MPHPGPIGIFDSGVGGLSILREVRQALPREHLLYFADQAHVPYGSSSLEDVRTLSAAIVRFLLSKGSKLIVVACNTASAASLHALRRDFPGTPFVGMEPAVKPAVGLTHSGTIGVLATPATFQGELYASVVDRYASGVRILQETLTGLVEEIEAGNLDGQAVEQIVLEGVRSLIEAGADTLVLGCTHFPFVLPLLRRVAGERATIIDPAPAIARQTARLLDQHDLTASAGMGGEIEYFTSGDPEHFAELLEILGMEAGSIRRVRWHEGGLILD